MTTSPMPVLTDHSASAEGTKTRLDLTFNTTMAARTGKIYVTDGAMRTVIDPETGALSTRIVGATHTVEIKVSDLHFSGTHVYTNALALLPDHEYSVLIDPGAMATDAGRTYAGLSRPGTVTFMTGSAPSVPTLDSIALLTDHGVRADDFLTFGDNHQLEGAIHGTMAPGQTFELLIGGLPANAQYLTLTTVTNGYTWRYDGPLPDGASTVAARIMGGGAVLDETHVTITVDRASPSVATSPDGAGAFGVNSPVVITFSEAVYWQESEGTADQLVLKDADNNITYVPLTSANLTDGGTKLTIPASDLHLAAGTDYRIYLPSTMRDLAGNIIGEYGIAFHTAAAAGDTTSPHALTAKVTNAAGSYNAGKPIEIRVAFDEPINFVDNAAPKLVLNNGGIAHFYEVSGSSEAVFHYTVAEGDDVATLDIADASSLATSFEDLAGNLLFASGIDFDVLTNAAGLPDSGIQIDTVAPGALLVPELHDTADYSPDDGIISDDTPTFSGAGAEAFAHIMLYAGDETIGEADADAAGNWQVTSKPLPEGVYMVTAKQVDDAGNESAASPEFKLTIDTSAPTTVGITPGAWVQLPSNATTFEVKFSDVLIVAQLGDVTVKRNDSPTSDNMNAHWDIREDADGHAYHVLSVSGLIPSAYSIEFQIKSPMNVAGIVGTNYLQNPILFEIPPP